MKLSPLLGALAYPYLLQIFHYAVADPQMPSPARILLAAIALSAALAVPLCGLLAVVRLGRIPEPSRFDLRALRLALLTIAAPPLFVLFGVGLGLLGGPLRDLTAWNLLWISAMAFGLIGSNERATSGRAAAPSLRVIHGAAAAVLAVFLLFHLSNHLTGLIGPDMHGRVMNMGRTVYRSGVVEPALIALLMFQIASGAWLAWCWSQSITGFHRAVQIGSGVYVGAFILTHLNSALISARTVRNIPTDWAWASGAPEGLIVDAWNIRLVPHYAFGAFFLLVHLCTGLRVVLVAHGVAERVANRLWILGVCGSAAVAIAIIAALCGFRL